MPRACLPLSPEMQKKEAYFQAADGPSPKGESVTLGPLSPRREQASPLRKHFPCHLEFSNSPFYGSQISLVRLS